MLWLYSLSDWNTEAAIHAAILAAKESCRAIENTQLIQSLEIIEKVMAEEIAPDTIEKTLSKAIGIALESGTSEGWSVYYCATASGQFFGIDLGENEEIAEDCYDAVDCAARSVSRKTVYDNLSRELVHWILYRHQS